MTNYDKTIKGVITTFYKCNVKNSKDRNHPLPKYTKEELSKWLFDCTNFKVLYENWVKSDYNKLKKPSIDRINDYKFYSFDNIQLITWEENFKKYNKDKIQEINCKQLSSVCQYDLENNLIRSYNSILSAQKYTGILSPHISRVCRGIRKSAGGFVWKYKN